LKKTKKHSKKQKKRLKKKKNKQLRQLRNKNAVLDRQNEYDIRDIGKKTSLLRYIRWGLYTVIVILILIGIMNYIK